MNNDDPSLANITHDKTNATQGHALIEIPYFPSSKGERKISNFIDCMGNILPTDLYIEGKHLTISSSIFSSSGIEQLRGDT